MTDSPVPPKMKLGFKACQSPRCDEPVYYKWDQCKVCGFVQVRAPKATQTEATTAADVDSTPTPAARPHQMFNQVDEAEVVVPVSASLTPAQVNKSLTEFAAEAAVLTPPTQLVPPADPYAPVSYIVMEDFASQIGDVHVRLKRGRVITDPTLIARLQSNNCPIRPTATVDNLACCPMCKHVFTPERLMPNTGRKGAA